MPCTFVGWLLVARELRRRMHPRTEVLSAATGGAPVFLVVSRSGTGEIGAGSCTLSSDPQGWPKALGSPVPTGARSGIEPGFLG
jgi:hypothetical protein